MICGRTDCAREATHAPKVCVPILGRAGRSLTVILGLATCEACLAGLTADDFLAPGDPGREHLRWLFGTQAAGRVVPDFEAACVVAVALDSPEMRGSEAAEFLRRSLH